MNDVAIVGIPYPPLDDYMKARSEEVSKRTRRNYLEELMQMPAYIAVRQAIGRSIRSPEDKSEVWLLDKRFNNIWWKKNIKCFNPKLVRL
nr:helicase C-terminal domain-containing protein [Sulfuracidifex metallicus]